MCKKKKKPDKAQIKALKDLQKTWETIDQDHFKKYNKV